MRHAVLWVPLALLAACGGGGGGGSSTSVSVSTSTLNFAQHDQDDVPPAQAVRVTFNGDGLAYGYPPETPDTAMWLTITEQGATATEANFAVSTSTHMPAGTHHTTLRFLTAKVGDNGQLSGIKYKDVQVTLVVDDYLKVGPTRHELVAYEGTGRSQDAAIDVSGDIPGWVATSPNAWLKFRRASGSIAEDVEFYADPSGLARGNYFGTVNVGRNDGGTPVATTVVLTVQRNMLVPEQRAVSFLQFPGDPAPAPVAVEIHDAAGNGVAWTASTYGENWVTFNTSGAAGEPLVIGVNPAARQWADDVTYTNFVQVVPNPPNGMPTLVQIGYMRPSGADPGAYTIEITPAVPATPLREQIALNPLRHKAYVTNGTDTVRVFDLMTGVEGPSLSVPGALLDQPLTSMDNQRIFVLDAATVDSPPGWQARKVRTIDPYYPKFEWHGWTFLWPGDSELEYIESFMGGYNVLVTNRGEIIHVGSGERLRDAQVGATASPDFARLIATQVDEALYFFRAAAPAADGCGSVVRQSLRATVGSVSNDYEEGPHLGVPREISLRDDAGACVGVEHIATDVAHSQVFAAAAGGPAYYRAANDPDATDVPGTPYSAAGAVRFVTAVPNARHLVIEELAGAEPGESRAVFLRDAEGAILADLGRFGPGAESATLDLDGRRATVIERDEAGGKIRLHVVPVP
jgi:hypothetical protein